MYIKYLVIKKYKSYRELTYMDQLSNGINVIIGANGNGKSNFLDAIIFVLTDKYQNLRQEDKKLLLHEEQDDNSEESGIISIEIIIDNKKRDFPIDKDTISIIKIYNTKENKEEMMINNKKLLKADITYLLESAGFSRVNPYYFIQQGKINMMINMNDFEYFEMFSEVTGIKTYEDKKLESLKLLDECKESRNKIVKQKDEINDYIEKLNNQCEDLKEFVKLEEKRKAYDSFLINERILEIQVNCEFLEERKKEKLINMEEIGKKQNRIKNKINMNLNEINKLNKLSLSLKSKIQKCNEEINNIEKFKFQSESNLRFIKDSNNNLENNIENLERELNKINDEKEKSEKNLKNIEKKIKALDKEIENCQKNYNQAKNSSDYLLLKSPSERNKFINTEIQKLNSSKKFIDDNIIDIQKQINENKEKIKEKGRQLEEYENKFNSTTKKILEINKKLIESKNQRKDIINNIKRNDI
jgi:structural maintenance of chromosome 3 (chondroitin sulfate proteoglycan 6)